MSAKLFSLRRSSGPPSTQFAPTIMAMPDPPPAPAAVTEAFADEPPPESLPPDSLATDGSGAPGASPDIVTDLGGLPAGSPDPAAAPTLSHIGRYALKRQLGAGGLGTVFEAWDPLLSRAVAVKTLQLDADPTERSSLDGLFLNEARAAAGLNHRCIVTIHDAGLSPHGVYIAMERLYGRDLQCAIADGWRPSVEQTVQLIRRVNEALAYAHARGVVHCDIKPANIFLQRKDRPKVLDFGIARILHGAQMPPLDGALVGSPRYRAPEQLQGGAVDARTDLFSLGVVMYELLTGRRAFGGDTLAEINHAVLETDPPAAHVVEPAVPPEVSAIVSRLMARAPADRYTCASELNADLRRWLADHAAPGDLTLPAGRPLVPPRPAAPARRSLPRSRWLAAAAAALALGALALTALLPWPSASDPTPPAAAPASPTPGPPSPSPSPSPPASPSPGLAAETSPPPTVAAAEPTAAAALQTPVQPRPALRPAPPPTGAGVTSRRRSSEPLAPEPARVDEVRATTAPAPAAVTATGQVLIAVSPWAEVEVDGQPRGTAPPLARLELSEGPHQITLRNADFAPHTAQVQVSAERPVTLRHRFGS